MKRSTWMIGLAVTGLMCGLAGLAEASLVFEVTGQVYQYTDNAGGGPALAINQSYVGTITLDDQATASYAVPGYREYNPALLTFDLLIGGSNHLVRTSVAAPGGFSTRTAAIQDSPALSAFYDSYSLQVGNYLTQGVAGGVRSRASTGGLFLSSSTGTAWDAATMPGLAGFVPPLGLFDLKRIDFAAADYTRDSATGNVHYDLEYSGRLTVNSLQLQVAAVPEPSTFVMAGIMGVFGAGYGLKRRRMAKVA